MYDNPTNNEHRYGPMNEIKPRNYGLMDIHDENNSDSLINMKVLKVFSASPLMTSNGMTKRNANDLSISFENNMTNESNDNHDSPIFKGRKVNLSRDYRKDGIGIS